MKIKRIAKKMEEKNVFVKNKKPKQAQQGSAIVLMVLVLVNALIIVSVIASISLVEGRMSSNIKNSTPAFQAADSGIEWVLKTIGDENDSSKMISEVFGSLAGDGKFDCPAGDVGGVICELYFIQATGEVITNEDTAILEIDSVRSIGRRGTDDQAVSRAVEVSLAIAGCPSGYEEISDFCIEVDEHTDSDDNVIERSFEGAADSCFEVDARLCTAAEWSSACQMSAVVGLNDMDDNWERVDDLATKNRAAIFGFADCDDVEEQSLNNTHRFRCCMNTN
ncbi:hypothetical protein HN784_04995 [bacterium]|nr:hypothetical protein [bacterium]MBT4250747.1 hypothetical protein [bacterium]MBT4598170.1 hypothetical protein [bacterium]MBT6753768.1 hypothetical protein [bacterium]MBT7037519.1 hypothetical protein [bacterium]